MIPSGPSNARIMIVGDAPQTLDIMKGMPFSGPNGYELDRMLQEAGILRTHCFVTNLVHEVPPKGDMNEWIVKLVNAPKPGGKYLNTNWVRWRDVWVNPAVARGWDQLLKHIELVKPTLVIALGNGPLFALTGEWGIKSWRGSQLIGRIPGHEFKVIPAYTPSAVNRDWSIRGITVHDLRRAERESHTPLPYNVPKYERVIRPNFAQVCKWLGQVRVVLAQGQVISSTDIETRAGHIACTGFYIKGLPTMCIPWMCEERPEGYWAEAEELYIWREVRKMMTHPNFKIVGQNWPYDSQYKYRWLFGVTEVFWDTMTAEHCMYPGMPKGLDYLSSKYCEFHRYWKDDIKEWDPKIGEEQFWNYNCEDCERTYEVYENQSDAILNDPRLQKVWDFQTNRLQRLLGKAMRRGIKANVKDKAALSIELDGEIKIREGQLKEILGHDINWGSPLQLQKLFYVDLKQKEIKNKKSKTGGLTTDDQALELIAKREPLLRGVIRRIQELRSIGVFKSTFVEARLDRDYRIRCSFNIGGTVTFRLSSSQNAFGSGLNLQNVPKGNDDPDPGELQLPNIRKLFIPDEGMTIFDMDLQSADLYTVVWESDDELFRYALEHKVDTHLLNAGSLFGIKELLDLDRYLDKDFVKWAKVKYAKQREFAKPWCHGTNYGGGDRTMAATVGITVRENERFRTRYFSDHPGIKRWHERTEHQLKTQRFVENKFGYRWYIFDRPDGLLPEALAWVPQSTTGCVINRAWDNIDVQLSQDVEVLIQVHDSLVGQFDTSRTSELLPKIEAAAKVIVPYERPLVIPVGIKSSPISWGHC